LVISQESQQTVPQPKFGLKISTGPLILLAEPFSLICKSEIARNKNKKLYEEFDAVFYNLIP
jgi:hypothetical protein